jgi:hypothetical protein
VIVVVAGRSDAAAAALVESWPPDRGRLLTCDDLASAGWRITAGDPAGWRAVVQGDLVPTHRIAGVLTRLPSVTEVELPMIAAEDRHYAAAEMTAFLGYWLTSLPCPVLNRPGAVGLCAPGWRTEQWLLVAHRLGIAAQPRRRRVPAFESSPAEPTEPGTPTPRERLAITVLGERCIGSADPELTGQARALAAAAGVELLTVSFGKAGSAWTFLDAHPWADVHQPEIASALTDYFPVGASR